MSLTVETFALGPLETNSYIAHNGTEAIAVDAGGEPGAMLDYLAKHNLTLAKILTTHLHFDHIYGNNSLAKATGAEILASPDDEYMLATELGGGGFMGLPKVDDFSFTPLSPGETTLLGEQCQVLSTPGHTPGSLSYYFPDSHVIFVGDVLFYRGIGRSDFPGGDQATLLQSIRDRIFTLPKDTVVYSGHGLATTVGDEMINNPYTGSFSR